MPKLPLTVQQVIDKGGQGYEVIVVYADGSLGHYLIPVTMATVEGVTISALAMGVLSDVATPMMTGPHRVHRRYAPRS